MKSLTLNPIDHVEGVVQLPGSKSISNRVLLLAALAEGTTRITNLLDSDDTRYMLDALVALDIGVSSQRRRGRSHRTTRTAGNQTTSSASCISAWPVPRIGR